MFSITSNSINTKELREQVKTEASGAISVFEGIVRNHHQGRVVKALEYEAMESLAQREASDIIEEAKQKFDVHHIACVHRVGRLDIGDIAIWIGVSAAHRDDSFKACRYVIDEIKKRLPIWKKEFYVDGEPKWVNCSCVHGHNHQKEEDIYARQVVLSDVGKEGQEKLKKARVLVVGAGGLGSAVLPYLASVGVGTIGVCEHDSLEASNLNRQTIYNYQDIGQPKVQLAAQRIKALNPFIHIVEHPHRLDCSNIDHIAAEYAIIIDCTDDMATKFLLNDYVVLNRKPLIQSSVYQHEGQIQVIHPQTQAACLRCLWENIPDPSCLGTCEEVGVLGVVPGFFGTLQAAEAINIILRGKKGLLDKTILVDLKTYTLTKIRSQKNVNCVVCSHTPKITCIDSNNYEPTKIPAELDLNQLSIDEFLQCTLVDLREDEERVTKSFKCDNLVHIPLSQWSDNHLDKDKKYLLFCAKGLRSAKTAQKLQSKGYDKVYSVGGIKTVESFLNNRLVKKE